MNGYSFYAFETEVKLIERCMEISFAEVQFEEGFDSKCLMHPMPFWVHKMFELEIP